MLSLKSSNLLSSISRGLSFAASPSCREKVVRYYSNNLAAIFLSMGILTQFTSLPTQLILSAMNYVFKSLNNQWYIQVKQCHVNQPQFISLPALFCSIEQLFECKSSTWYLKNIGYSNVHARGSKQRLPFATTALTLSCCSCKNNNPLLSLWFFVYELTMAPKRLISGENKSKRKNSKLFNFQRR